MTIDLFDAYVSELPALRAERLLDAAHAANPSESWVQGMVQTIRRAAGDLAVAGRSLFTVDGEPVGVAGLKKWFRSTLRGGFR